jgi:protein-tyrosine phosphatase
MDFFFVSIDKIIPGLYIGNAVAATTKKIIKNENIKLIVNCTTNTPNAFERDGIQYINLKIDDSKKSNKQLFTQLPQILRKIRLYILYNKNVLVHCFAGKSRSATVIAAYLIKFHKYTPKTAIDFIISKHPQAFNGGNRIIFKDALASFYEFYS